MPKVNIQIVTWNSLRYIFDCLESLMRQSFRDFSILVVDNGSDDGTVEFIRNYYPVVSILQNFRNVGFAKANNQGIQLAKGEYVLVMNSDVILDQNFLQNIVFFADQHPEAGVFGGKILKLYSEALDKEDEGGLRKAIKTDVIDSSGLQIFKSRRVINRGEGEKDRGQYDRIEEVFGISGACVLYRTAALKEVMIRNEYFDQDFFAYKEDIDLAWRLRLHGWSCWYYPEAVCYHHRRFSSYQGRGLKKVVQMRREVSPLLKTASLRNHHLMIVKNEQLLNFFLTLPWFIIRTIGLIGYSLLFEFFQWKSLIGFFRYLPGALLKRRIIMAHKKAAPREIRKWFN